MSENLMRLWENSAALPVAMLLADGMASIWYAIPLVVVISLVYGATRHEHKKEIIEHSIRSAIWLAGFLFLIFLAVWFAGYGTNSESVSVQTIKYLIALVAWLSAGSLLTADAYWISKQDGHRCLLSAGLYCLIFGFKQGARLLIPTTIMLISLLWAISIFFSSF
jgi:hypothetical protein